MSITIVIPESVSTDERRKALARARQEFHRAQMQVGKAKRSRNLRAYSHALKAMRRAREVVRAWGAIQQTGRAA